MAKAMVLDDTGRTTVWIQAVEVSEDDQGRIFFWSPYEDPDRPDKRPCFFNNQKGVVQGDILTLRYADGSTEQVEVFAPPQTDLGNKGRIQFQIKRLA
jgi:hypothetical protein